VRSADLSRRECGFSTLPRPLAVSQSCIPLAVPFDHERTINSQPSKARNQPSHTSVHLAVMGTVTGSPVSTPPSGEVKRALNVTRSPLGWSGAQPSENT
jgi:hypothetical protein